MRNSNVKLTLLASLLFFFYSLAGFGQDTVKKTVVTKWALYIYFDKATDPALIEELQPDAVEYFAYHRRVPVTNTGENEQADNNQIPMVPIISANALDETRTSGRFGDREGEGPTGSYRFFPVTGLPPEVEPILDETLSYAHSLARLLVQMNVIQRQFAPHRTNMPQHHTLNSLQIRDGRDWRRLCQPGTLLMIGAGVFLSFGVHLGAAIPTGHPVVAAGSPIVPTIWALGVSLMRTARYQNLWQIRLNLYRNIEDPGVLTAESAELYTRVIARLDEETYLSERRNMSHVQQVIYLRYFPDTITTSEEALSLLGIVPGEEDGDSLEVSRVTELPAHFPDAFPPEPSIAAGAETNPEEAVTGDVQITVNGEADADEEGGDVNTPLLPERETQITINDDNATTSTEEERDINNVVIDMSAGAAVTFQKFSK